MKADLVHRLKRLEACWRPPQTEFAAGDLIDALAVFAGNWRPGEWECDAYARSLGFANSAAEEAFFASVGPACGMEEFRERLGRALAVLSFREYGTNDPNKISPADLQQLAEQARVIITEQVPIGRRGKPLAALFDPDQSY